MESDVSIDENELNKYISSLFSKKDPSVKDQIEEIHPQIDFFYGYLSPFISLSPSVLTSQISFTK